MKKSGGEVDSHCIHCSNYAIGRLPVAAWWYQLAAIVLLLELDRSKSICFCAAENEDSWTKLSHWGWYPL